MKASVLLLFCSLLSCGLFTEDSKPTSSVSQVPTQAAVNELKDFFLKVQREVDDWVEIRDGYTKIEQLCNRIAPVCSQSTGGEDSLEPKLACLWLMKCSELAQASVAMSVTIDRDFISVFRMLHEGDLASAGTAVIKIISLVQKYEQILDQGEQLRRIFTQSQG